MIKSLKEGFSPDRMKIVTKKMTKVIRNRTGLPCYIGSAGPLAVTKEGKMRQLYATIGTKFYRFNVLNNGKSDIFYSLDDFGETPQSNGRPYETYNFNGFNIVQIMDQLCDILTGEFQHYANDEVVLAEARLQEKKSVYDFVKEWMVSTDASSIMKRFANGDKSNLLSEFQSFLNTNGSRKTMNPGPFAWYVGKIGDELNVPGYSSIPNASIASQPTSVSRLVDEDPDLEKEFEESMKSDAMTRYNEMRETVEMCFRQIPSYTGALLYGPPGMGKDTILQEVAQELGRTFFMIQARMSYTGMLGMFFEHKDKEIIVFSDADFMWGNEDMINLLKNLLVNSKKRTIGLGRDGLKTATGVMVPGEFEFNSSVFFLTNLVDKQIDSAIKSRLKGRIFNVDYTPEEIFGRVYTILNDWDLDDDDFNDIMDENERKECFEMLKYHSHRAATVSFRTVKAAFQQWAICLLSPKELSKSEVRRRVIRLWSEPVGA